MFDMFLFLILSRSSIELVKQSL